MLTKEEIIKQAINLGFADIGFTSVEDFPSQQKLLDERLDEYEWTAGRGVNLAEGIRPLNLYPEAKSMIVLLENYHKEAFPVSLLGKFGRCYLDDDRMTKDGLALKIKAFRSYLREYGIETRMPGGIPHRLAAARAGLGTLGKNNFLYANRTARQSSWVFPIVILADREFTPDEPSVLVGCPEWCRNACITACPTRALTGPGKIDPRRCISYLTYYGEGLTPLELREPMGTWVYGCDRCQTVCPRNNAWLTQELPVNEKVEAKAPYFTLPALLTMDEDYYKRYIRPHMFYMPSREIWRWKMNAARAMGNSLDRAYVPVLHQAWGVNDDERVKAMIAWALGRLGGQQAREILTGWLTETEGIVRTEVEWALENS